MQDQIEDWKVSKCTKDIRVATFNLIAVSMTLIDISDTYSNLFYFSKKSTALWYSILKIHLYIFETLGIFTS